MKPRKPTQEEFEGISMAITGEPDSSDVANNLIAVFPGDNPIAVVIQSDARKSWTLMTRLVYRPYWVIMSIGEPTLA